MQKILFLLAAMMVCSAAVAGKITGVVTDEKGNPISYASIYVKNGRQGTTTGVNGYYQLSLPAGEYILIAQHVGYAKKEVKIDLSESAITVNFILALQQAALAEVVVKAGAEDPAYAIIRNAIKKRKDHLEELSNFSCEVYTKEQLQLRDFPRKFMGQKVDFEDGDTSRRKILYLSESVSRYSRTPPGRDKLEVLSTRVSGNSNSFGLSLPRIINFYQNNILAEGISPRGFISPISNNALNYYRYRFDGSFWEDGVEINRIEVIPRRKYEPLFSGYIMITENTWRIHSLQLFLLKTSQMEILDTLKIEQLHAPFDQNTWVIRNQVLYPAIKMFGFDATGSSVTVYSNFDLEPTFAPKYFNNTVMKYYEGSNKKTAGYWDSIRPLPLQAEEILDYRRKDSLEQARKDPRYLDSLDRLRNKISITALLLTGETISRQKRRTVTSINPLLRTVSFNTVEGLSIGLSGSWRKKPDSNNVNKEVVISPAIRYGFSNRHFNARLAGTYSSGKKYPSYISMAGGKYVFQFNNMDPVGPLMNTFSSLLRENNHLKLYEAWFVKSGYTRELNNGFRMLAGIEYQQRLPVDNSTNYSWRQYKDRSYTPNYPVDILTAPMERHQAFSWNIGISWKPGQRYVEFPDRKMNLGSKYPEFQIGLVNGVRGLFGSDVDYLKWETGIKDDLNFKLGGLMQYAIKAGGFLSEKAVFAPDLKHFNGNRMLLATPYLSSFQALPYYRYSNAGAFWAEGHAEHHFNGMLTNKIPGFRQLNWYLVGGANVLWLEGNRHYGEVFIGLENILKLFRTDLIWTFDQGRFNGAFFRLSMRGLLDGTD